MIVDKLTKRIWSKNPSSHSLDEVYKTVPFKANGSFFVKLLAFTGPGYLIAVGYMDPGNWATDLAGGSKFGYALLSIVLLSSFIAMILQYLSAKLGIATGRDLARACRDSFPKPVSIALWLTAEVSIIACDIAEVIGSAIALKLIFHLPLPVGTVLTGADVLLILMFQSKGFRFIEALVMTLIFTIILCFGFELYLAKLNYSLVLAGLIPSWNILKDKEMLYIALGILGATVMPHNLYLHSSIVHTRDYAETLPAKKEAVKFAAIDSSMALFMAFFVNAFILVISAGVFAQKGYRNIIEIQNAYYLLTPLLGTGLAGTAFAIALLASGQNSSITGTMAGQVIMEGFLNLKIKPWLRRLITRSLAIVPSVIIVILFQEHGLSRLLLFSQVILSIQLSFAVFPLVSITSDKNKMGDFTNTTPLTILSYFIAFFIAGLNAWLIYISLRG